MRWIGIALTAIAVVSLDQSVKGIVRGTLLPGESIPSTGFLRVTYTTNTGSAFGLFPDQGFLLTIISMFVIGILLYYFRQDIPRGRVPLVSLGFILGGAAGNLVDRLMLGYVVDFIDVGVWPIFNIADSSIVIGAVLLLWIGFKGRHQTNSFKSNQLASISTRDSDTKE